MSHFCRTEPRINSKRRAETASDATVVMSTPVKKQLEEMQSKRKKSAERVYNLNNC